MSSRSALLVATTRLAAESDRADAAEGHVAQLLATVRTLNQEKLQLRADLSRSHHELQLWKVQLDLAQKEILRAQNIVDQVDRARIEAEERAHRYLQRVRQLLEERSIQVAIDEGRRAGFQEGLEFGRRRQPQPTQPNPAPVRAVNIIPPRPPSTAPVRPPSAAPIRPPSTAPIRPPSAVPARPSSTAPASMLRPATAQTGSNAKESSSMIQAPSTILPPSSNTAPAPVPPVPVAPTSAPDSDPPEEPNDGPINTLPVPPDNFIPVINQGQGHSEITLPPPHEWLPLNNVRSRSNSQSAAAALTSTSVKSQQPISRPSPPRQQQQQQQQQPQRQHPQHSPTTSKPPSATSSHISISNFGLVATPEDDPERRTARSHHKTQPERIAEEWRSHNPDVLTPTPSGSVSIPASAAVDSRPVITSDVIPRPMSSDPFRSIRNSQQMNPPQRPTTTDPSRVRTTRKPPQQSPQPPPPPPQQPQIIPARQGVFPIPVSSVFYDPDNHHHQHPASAAATATTAISTSGDWSRPQFQRQRSQSVTSSKPNETQSGLPATMKMERTGVDPLLQLHPNTRPEPVDRPATVAPSVAPTTATTATAATTNTTSSSSSTAIPYPLYGTHNSNKVPYIHIPRPPSTTTSTTLATIREKPTMGETIDTKKLPTAPGFVPLSPIPTISNLTSIPESDDTNSSSRRSGTSKSRTAKKMTVINNRLEESRPLSSSSSPSSSSSRTRSYSLSQIIPTTTETGKKVTLSRTNTNPVPNKQTYAHHHHHHHPTQQHHLTTGTNINTGNYNVDYFSSVPGNLGPGRQLEQQHHHDQQNFNSLFAGRGVPYYYNGGNDGDDHDHDQRFGRGQFAPPEDIVVMNARIPVQPVVPVPIPMPTIPEREREYSDSIPQHASSPARLDRPISLFSDI